VKAARRLRRRPGRGATDEVLVEGRALREALPFLRLLFLSDRASAPERRLATEAAATGCRVIPVTPAVVASITETVAPQGLVGVATLPLVPLEQALDGASLVVVAWEVRDPGNLGAIVRCADAAGADAVILTGHGVDPGNPKAVRASAGSVFHLPVVCGVAFADLAAAGRARGLRLVAADPSGPVDVAGVDLARPVALVFGNEAHGLAEEVAADCDVVARIRMHRGSRPGFPDPGPDSTAGAESLNLAAAVAIFTYEAARQRRARRP
jgi:TrmH family RNA methyltransferase